MGAFKSTTNSFFEKWKLISVNEMPVTEEEVILGIIDEKTMVMSEKDCSGIIFARFEQQSLYLVQPGLGQEGCFVEFLRPSLHLELSQNLQEGMKAEVETDQLKLVSRAGTHYILERSTTDLVGP